MKDYNPLEIGDKLEKINVRSVEMTKKRFILCLELDEVLMKQTTKTDKFGIKVTSAYIDEKKQHKYYSLRPYAY